MKTSTTVGALKILVATAAIAAMGNAAPLFTITDLGSIGGDSAVAFGVNATGATAGQATDAFGNMHAVYSNGGTIVSLSASASVSDSSANDMNAAGKIVGTQYANGQAYATVWSATGGSYSPSIIAGQGSYATAINESGQVTGMLTASTASGQQGHAFVTSIDGTATDLGTFAGSTWTSGYDVNNSGQVAGYGMKSNGQFRAFVWSQATGYVTLGTLGGSNSYAMAINDNGQTVGSSQISGGWLHATEWNNGVAKDLGTLNQTGNSSAYGINAQGDVVGYSSITGGSNHAFLYRDGLLLDLNTLIGNNSDWILTAAYDINDLGQIAGTGLYQGVEHAFLLDVSLSPEPGNTIQSFSLTSTQQSAVPEPSTIATMGLALLLCGGTLMRRRMI